MFPLIWLRFTLMLFTRFALMLTEPLPQLGRAQPQSEPTTATPPAKAKPVSSALPTPQATGGGKKTGAKPGCGQVPNTMLGL